MLPLEDKPQFIRHVIRLASAAIAVPVTTAAVAAITAVAHITPGRAGSYHQHQHQHHQRIFQRRWEQHHGRRGCKRRVHDGCSYMHTCGFRPSSAAGGGHPRDAPYTIIIAIVLLLPSRSARECRGAGDPCARGFLNASKWVFDWFKIARFQRCSLSSTDEGRGSSSKVFGVF